MDYLPLDLKCPNCGSPEAHFIVTLTDPDIDYAQISIYECKCGHHWESKPKEVPDKGIFGKNMLSQITLLRFDDRLPLRKTISAIERQYNTSLTSKAVYDINKLEPSDSVLLTYYPEIARCVSCNTCTKSCPQDIEVMKYIQSAIRGDIAKCAEISFDCIQCGLCAMRCPADIKHYHVAQLARRIRGKYLDPKSKNLAKRLKEIEERKFDEEIEKLMKMDKKEIMELYRNRKIEAEESVIAGGD